MNGLTVAVIGCGRIGKMHVDNLLANFSEIDIKAVVDDNLDSQWAKQHGVEKVCPQQQLPDVLEDASIDAVIIATSSSAHVELIKAAAANGKHIFCEKPIGFTPEAIQQAIDAVETHQVILQVGLNRRFDPEFQRVQQTVADGTIGKPQIIKITNRDPKRPDLAFIPRSGGLFLDFNVHDFDMARFITGEEVKEVFAMGAVLVDKRIGELNDIDTAIITLKMTNDAICIIDTSREAVYGYDQRLEVFGSKGDIRADNLTETQTVQLSIDGALSEKPLYSFVERYHEAYRLELQAFFSCLMDNTQPSATAYDVQKAVVIAQAAQRSLQTNRPISLTRGD